MKEAEEKQTSLSNVDEDTFARFAEFIYGGNYNATEPLIVLDIPETERSHFESNSPKLSEAVAVEDDFPAEAPAEADSPPAEEVMLDEWSFGHSPKRNANEVSRSQFETGFHHSQTSPSLRSTKSHSPRLMTRKLGVIPG
jgi:hypothetical protein